MNVVMRAATPPEPKTRRGIIECVRGSISWKRRRTCSERRDPAPYKGGTDESRYIELRVHGIPLPRYCVRNHFLRKRLAIYDFIAKICVTWRQVASCTRIGRAFYQDSSFLALLFLRSQGVVDEVASRIACFFLKTGPRSIDSFKSISSMQETD